MTIRFNAWRYDKNEELWAAFALKLIEDLKRQASFGERLAAEAKLFCRRFNWQTGWLNLLIAVIVFGAFGYVLIVAATDFFTGGRIYGTIVSALSTAAGGKGGDKLLTLSTLCGAAGYLILLAFAFRKTRETFFNPLVQDLRRHLAQPDYQKHSAFLDDFHRDFQQIVNAYAGVDRAVKNKAGKIVRETRAQKVFVFIDDLDRCEGANKPRLLKLLRRRLGNYPVPLNREKYSLEKIDLNGLLQVSPANTASRASAPPATNENLRTELEKTTAKN